MDVKQRCLTGVERWVNTSITSRELREDLMVVARLEIWRRYQPGVSFKYLWKSVFGAVQHELRKAPHVHVPAYLGESKATREQYRIECWMTDSIEERSVESHETAVVEEVTHAQRIDLMLKVVEERDRDILTMTLAGINPRLIAERYGHSHQWGYTRVKEMTERLAQSVRRKETAHVDAVGVPQVAGTADADHPRTAGAGNRRADCRQRPAAAEVQRHRQVPVPAR